MAFIEPINYETIHRKAEVFMVPELDINVLDNKIANECCKDCINKCNRDGRLSLLKDHRIIISSSALGRLNSDGTYSYDKRNEKINAYCIDVNTN